MIGAIAVAFLAVVAYACSLPLVDVRPYAVFQHYQSWQWIATHRPIGAFVVAGQLLVVIALAWRLRAQLRSVIAGALSARSWILFAALAGFSLAVPTESVSRSLGEVLLAGGLALIAAMNLVVAVLMVPGATMERLSAWVGARVTCGRGADAKPWDAHLPLVVAIWIALAGAVASVGALERVPHIDDSISNFFQAKYFAAGHLYLPAPPDTRSFQVDQTVVDAGKWFGYAFPAWPAVLALGVLAGVPWLVNPVLGGLLVLLTHALVTRRADRGTANVTVLLMAGSPWLIFMSAEFMAHPLTAVLVVGAALAFDRATAREGRWGSWAVAAGLAAGALMLTRAIDGAIVLAALGVTVVIDRRLVRAWPSVAIAGVAAIAMAALIFPYNQAVTGRATYPPHMAWSDGHWGPGVDRLGFGPDVGIRAWPNLDPLPGHGPADVVLNANKNAFMTNIDLFGWACGSLLFVWFACGIGRWRRADGLMIVLVAGFVAGYSVYWFSGGPDLGARYWYPLLVPFAALSARGATMVSERLRECGAISHTGTRVGAFIVVACVSALVVTVPWRGVTKYYRYRGISGEIRDLAASHGFNHALVFVRAEANRRDFASAFNLNPVTLDDPGTIYALDAGSENRALVVAHFPDRPVWVIGRGVTDGGTRGPVEVLAGPLQPGTVPK